MEKMFQLEAVRPAQEFARFTPAHLGFMFSQAGREKIPPQFFLWRIYLCKYWTNYDDGDEWFQDAAIRGAPWIQTETNHDTMTLED